MDDVGPPPQPEPAPRPPASHGGSGGVRAPSGWHPRADAAAREAARVYVGALAAATPRIRLAWALLAANVGVYGFMVACGVDPMNPTAQDIVRWGGDAPSLTADGQWWRLVSATFVHIGLLHLAVNMYCLYVLGPMAERLLGPLGFLVVYLAAGVAGSLAYHAFGPEGVAAGASGSIFGLFGATLAYALRLRRTLPSLLRRDFLRTALINVAVNLALGLSMPGISTSAHVGGAVGGFLATWPLAAEPTREAVAARPRRAALVAVGSAVAATALAWALHR